MSKITKFVALRSCKDLKISVDQNNLYIFDSDDIYSNTLNQAIANKELMCLNNGILSYKKLTEDQITWIKETINFDSGELIDTYEYKNLAISFDNKTHEIFVVTKDNKYISNYKFVYNNHMILVSIHHLFNSKLTYNLSLKEISFIKKYKFLLNNNI